MNHPLFCATVLYPNEESVAFDFELYSKKLIPEYAALLGENCVKFEIRKGLASPGTPLPHFICTASFWIVSAEKFAAAMGTAEMNELMKRIGTFIDIHPIRQFDAIIP
jgi:hypothetical protein